MSDSQEAQEDPQTRRLSAFVGRNADYYLANWAQRLRSGTGRAGFNWAACLLSGFWLPYRKMYKLTVLLYAITLAETALEDVVFIGVLRLPKTPDAFGSVFTIAVSVVVGLYGNVWYLSHARNAVAELSREAPSEDALLAALAKRGGASYAAMIGMVLLAIVVSIAVLFAVDSYLGAGYLYQ